MSKTVFIGFGEVNTPEEVIVKKCADAEKSGCGSFAVNWKHREQTCWQCRRMSVRQIS